MTDHQDTRPPLDPAPATGPGGTEPWRVEVVDSSASTNADVADRFRAGESHGLVLAAEHQSAGRGRLGREWVTPARSSLTVSFLLVPDGAWPERWPWLPVMAGLAAADAVRRESGLHVGLKWPNDLLVGDLKVGGILLERVEHAGVAAAVVGIGINCDQTAEELPVAQATSLALADAPVNRSDLLTTLVEELGERYEAWREGADLRPDYLDLCTTLGQQVQVAVPGGQVVGVAVDVDEAGRLVVRTQDGEERLGAGDVVHVRPA